MKCLKMRSKSQLNLSLSLSYSEHLAFLSAFFFLLLPYCPFICLHHAESRKSARLTFAVMIVLCTCDVHEAIDVLDTLKSTIQ